jgi:hypothetical protein
MAMPNAKTVTPQDTPIMLLPLLVMSMFVLAVMVQKKLEMIVKIIRLKTVIPLDVINTTIQKFILIHPLGGIPSKIPQLADTLSNILVKRTNVFVLMVSRLLIPSVTTTVPNSVLLVNHLPVL